MNKFDSANYPTTEPTELIAGDYVAWKIDDIGADYPPASYAMTYSARMVGNEQVEIAITATGSGSTYTVAVASNVTATWQPGVYQWQRYITRSSDSARITDKSGFWTIKRDAAVDSADGRTHGRIVLAAIETAIQTLASKTVMSYTIFGRQMTYADIPKLEQMRQQYKAEVANEERIANGLGGKKITVRFTR